MYIDPFLKSLRLVAKKNVPTDSARYLFFYKIVNVLESGSKNLFVVQNQFEFNVLSLDVDDILVLITKNDIDGTV